MSEEVVSRPVSASEQGCFNGPVKEKYVDNSASYPSLPTRPSDAVGSLPEVGKLPERRPNLTSVQTLPSEECQSVLPSRSSSGVVSNISSLPMRSIQATLSVEPEKNPRVFSLNELDGESRERILSEGDDEEPVKRPRENNEPQARPLKKMMLERESREEADKVLESDAQSLVDLGRKVQEKEDTHSKGTSATEDRSEEAPAKVTPIAATKVEKPKADEPAEKAVEKKAESAPEPTKNLHGGRKRRTTEPTDFQCMVDGCGLYFSTRSSLVRHNRIHTGEKPFHCQFPGCGKSFSQSTHLTIHTRTHTGERPFKCKFDGCRQTFFTQSDLTTHIRIHTREKPYQCAFPGCGKAFARKSDQRTHEYTHTQERPHHCKYEGCFRSFSKSSDLSKHHRTHTGHRPYTCAVPGCGRRFAVRSNLLTHLRRERHAAYTKNDFRPEALEKFVLCDFKDEHGRRQQDPDGDDTEGVSEGETDSDSDTPVKKAHAINPMDPSMMMMNPMMFMMPPMMMMPGAAANASAAGAQMMANPMAASWMQMQQQMAASAVAASEGAKNVGGVPNPAMMNPYASMMAMQQMYGSIGNGNQVMPGFRPMVAMMDPNAAPQGQNTSPKK